MPDGFTTQQTIDEAGTAAAGAFMSVAGVPIDDFQGAGRVRGGLQADPRRQPIDPYAIYGAQAAHVLLDAIAASDGTRESILEQLFQAKVENGYLGSFEINENGDPSGAEGAVVGFRSTRRPTSSKTETTISPKGRERPGRSRR